MCNSNLHNVPTFKKNCISDIQKVFIRPTKLHPNPIYKMCASNLQKLRIQLTKVVHPTYESCVSDLQKVCIRPTKVFSSDLQMYVHSTNLCAIGTVIHSNVNYILTRSAVSAIAVLVPMLK